MNTTNKTLGLMVLCFAVSGFAGAQQQATPATSAPAAKPPKQTAQSEAGDPRADTSNPAIAEPAAPAAATPAAVTAAPVTGRGQGARAAPESKPGVKSIPKIDRLDLGTATVTGDREQPKVMYIVPWKRSDIGDLAGKPMNSLVDEILAPVDRDVFKREVVYYHAVQADASQNGASPKPSQQGEK
ncbi:MAG TPA: hypothetical protein VGO37_21315 [Steroidobacteraceae bacterium]|jgi:hypothetical protein|nr:hypothetical protein [Steroidobacteraceae bacterium]